MRTFRDTATAPAHRVHSACGSSVTPPPVQVDSGGERGARRNPRHDWQSTVQPTENGSGAHSDRDYTAIGGLQDIPAPGDDTRA